MCIKNYLKLAILGIFALILISISTSLAAANVVPQTHMDLQDFAITANSIKPPECAGINLSTILVGDGRIKGKNRDELILGSPYDDVITSGKKGDDCILGGAGDDDITGNGSTSICIGGPGNDTFTDCGTIYQ